MPATPVAVFAFRRPAHLSRMLAALQRCSRLNECRVVIFCDGVRQPSDLEPVAETRRLARDWANAHGAEVVEQAENLGLARSIVAGVTRLCAESGRAIVLEDDLLPAERCLDFLLTALDRYADEKRIMQVSAFMFPVKNPPKPDAFFLPQTTTWGWATWARAWQCFEWKPDISALDDPAVRRAFDLDDAYPYTELLENRLRGRNDSWGILWWWAVFRSGGLVLHPRISLVGVSGYDGSGTHCRADSVVPGSNEVPPDAGPMIDFPAELTVDNAALTRVCSYIFSLRTQKPGIPWWRRIFRNA